MLTYPTERIHAEARDKLALLDKLDNAIKHYRIDLEYRLSHNRICSDETYSEFDMFRAFNKLTDNGELTETIETLERDLGIDVEDDSDPREEELERQFWNAMRS